MLAANAPKESGVKWAAKSHRKVSESESDPKKADKANISEAGPKRKRGEEADLVKASY